LRNEHIVWIYSLFAAEWGTPPHQILSRSAMLDILNVCAAI
jgi:hypothetical protein